MRPLTEPGTSDTGQTARAVEAGRDETHHVGPTGPGSVSGLPLTPRPRTQLSSFVRVLGRPHVAFDSWSRKV